MKKQRYITVLADTDGNVIETPERIFELVSARLTASSGSVPSSSFLGGGATAVKAVPASHKKGASIADTLANLATPENIGSAAGGAVGGPLGAALGRVLGSFV